MKWESPKHAIGKEGGGKKKLNDNGERARRSKVNIDRIVTHVMVIMYHIANNHSKSIPSLRLPHGTTPALWPL